MVTTNNALERFLSHWVKLVQDGKWVPVISNGWIRVRRPDRDIRPVPPVGAVTVCLYGDTEINPQTYFDKGELLGLTNEEVSELYLASDFSNPKGSAAELRRRLLAPIQPVS